MQVQATQRQTLDARYRQLRARQEQLPAWLIGGLSQATGRPYLARNVRITLQVLNGTDRLDPLLHPEVSFSDSRYAHQVQELQSHVLWWERVARAATTRDDSFQLPRLAASLRQIRTRDGQLSALVQWCENHAAEGASWHLDVMISKNEEAEALRSQVTILGLDTRRAVNRLVRPFLGFTDTHLHMLASLFGSQSQGVVREMTGQMTAHARLLGQETSVLMGRSRNLATQMRKLQVEEAEVPVQVPG